jgi:WD repeat-containing protein 68
MRLAWNKQDSNYIATMAMDHREVFIIDVRQPGVPIAELRGHNNTVNSIAWAPSSATHICTAGDDSLALIWDLANSSNSIDDPILSYTADAEINMLQWSELYTSWLGISFNQKLQLLKV